MKKMTSILSMLILLIVLTTGCSRKQEYTNVIPSNAYIVGSADLVALVEKSGLLTQSGEAKQLILGILEHGVPQDVYKQIEKILTSPRESGLDLEARIYMFTSTEFIYPVWVCKVDNQSKLTTTLDLLSKEKFCQPITKGDGYSYVTIEGNKILAFNEYSAVITAAVNVAEMKNLEANISKLMKQTSTNSIESTPAFDELIKEHSDIDFMASLAAIPEIYSQQLKTSTGMPHLDLSDVTALGKLSFEKGEMTLKFEYFTENKDIEALLKQQAQATKTLSREYLPYFPESVLAFASVGANGKAMYSLILDNKDLRDFMPSANSAVAKAIFDALDGDISIAITDVSMNASSSFIAYADVSDTNILNVLYANRDSILSSGQEVIKINDNEFQFVMSGFKAYYGIKNNSLYATNDKKMLDNLFKEVKPSIDNAPYANDIKGKNFFLLVNIGQILELPMIKMLAGFGGQEYQMYYHLASKINYFEMSTTMENVSEMSIILKDTETNSLKQIVDFARQFIGL